MKKIIAIIAALVVSVSAFAQNYQSAVGLKIGYDVALTYKTHVGSSNALDLGVNLSGLFGPNGLGVLVNGFYTWEKPLGAVSGLSWYAGPGAFVGLHIGDPLAFNASINAILGLEYKFAGAPVALSIDWTPGLNLTGIAFSWHGGGLGVKYTF
ncbi:MAG: hypothetical protein IKA45_07965 [Bacteroidales bacterium]|nr:hypothetical protein [Bacteroidales bacterium]